MTRFNVALLAVAVFLGASLGTYFALRQKDQPAPYLAHVEYGEPPEADKAQETVTEADGPTVPQPPAWTLRVGPTDKGGEEGPTLRAPDQPGWTTRVGPTAYGVTLADLVNIARTSVHLGEIEGEAGALRVDPFILAALPLKDTERPEDDDIVLFEQVVRLLREQKVISFASPMVLSIPSDPNRPETWEDERQAWAGVPVPPGTKLAKPLHAVPFDGADVVAGECEVPVTGAEENWGALIAAAREVGREPAFPLLYRYSGWIPALKDIHTQLALPLTGPTVPPH